MVEKTPVSHWDKSAVEEDFSADLPGDPTTEVAIVGGGFTGLSTALHLAEKGVACQVLEARRIGHGGSGRNVGYVNPGVWLPPQDVRAQLGDEKGGLLVETLGAAPEYVFSLIERHQIRCEVTKTGTIHAAHSPKGFDDLKRRAGEWRRLGAPVDLLDRDQAAEKIGSTYFHGGLLDHRAGTINPMGYVRGLARAAKAAGAKIATGVKVEKLDRDGDVWKVHTPSGTVRARTVVLGTNAYTDDLWPGLSKTMTLIHYFQLVTEPLGERVATILPERQGVWDTAPVMTSIRRDAGNRLLIGSMGKVIGGATGLSRRWAEKRLDRLFPDLGPVTFEDSWFGRIAMTPDHLFRVHKLADNLYTPIGYNGRGITTGTVFGRAMADLVTGGKEEDLPVPVSTPKTVKSAPFMSALYSTAFALNQFVRSL